MKKLSIILLLCLNCCFASKWVDIFENQYLDFDSIVPTYTTNVISFWIKKYPANKKEKFENKKYLFSVHKMDIDCKNKKSRISATAVYDKNRKLIYNTEEVSNWDLIIPDTYADGYYRLFCLIPFSDNPLINKSKQ